MADHTVTKNVGAAADDHEATDALFDTTPAAMAARFGRRTLDLLRQGRDVREAAHLAASYAFKADPSLRLQDDVCRHQRLTLLTDGVVTLYRCDDCGVPLTHVLGGGFYDEVKH